MRSDEIEESPKLPELATAKFPDEILESINLGLDDSPRYFEFGAV